jgi:hypothetical protein
VIKFIFFHFFSPLLSHSKDSRAHSLVESEIHDTIGACDVVPQAQLTTAPVPPLPVPQPRQPVVSVPNGLTDESALSSPQSQGPALLLDMPPAQPQRPPVPLP